MRAPARALALGLALVLAGCATGPRPVPDDRAAAWEAQRARLQALDAWRAEGRLVVRSGNEGGQVAFTWTERPDGTFGMRMAGPWGQGMARLTGGDGRAALRGADGARYVAADAAELLAGVYGWDVPVAGLRRWLVGLPAAGADYTLDRFGRVTALDWQDWRVLYRRYRQVDGTDLPAVLTATRAPDGTEIRVAIDRWRLGAGGDGDARPADSPVPLIGD